MQRKPLIDKDFFVRNHVKLRVLYCVAMGLVDLWGIADLYCQKVESTKWLKHKLEANSLNKLMADLGFLFL